MRERNMILTPLSTLEKTKDKWWLFPYAVPVKKRLDGYFVDRVFEDLTKEFKCD